MNKIPKSNNNRINIIVLNGPSLSEEQKLPLQSKIKGKIHSFNSLFMPYFLKYKKKIIQLPKALIILSWIVNLITE